ncbi:hypothetical protein [Mesorhizobium sp. M0768]|uniref:ABC transporter permease subunit n=1 Tax=Mesorhizobium sp. M0768 TaxID=2956996 RepID=UPI0033352D90
MHGFAWITHRGGQIVFGVAINFIAGGSTIILARPGSGRARAGALRRLALRGDHSAQPEAVRGVLVLGPVYSELISGHWLLVYVATLMVPFTWLVLFRTRFGLRLRAVGENPAAVGTTGISVTCLRYRGASSPTFWRAWPARTCRSPRMPAS